MRRRAQLGSVGRVWSRRGPPGAASLPDRARKERDANCHVRVRSAFPLCDAATLSRNGLRGRSGPSAHRSFRTLAAVSARLASAGPWVPTFARTGANASEWVMLVGAQMRVRAARRLRPGLACGLSSPDVRPGLSRARATVSLRWRTRDWPARYRMWRPLPTLQYTKGTNLRGVWRRYSAYPA